MTVFRSERNAKLVGPNRIFGPPKTHFWNLTERLTHFLYCFLRNIQKYRLATLEKLLPKTTILKQQIRTWNDYRENVSRASLAGVKILVDFLQGPNNSSHNFRVCVALSKRLTELTNEQQLSIVGEDLTTLQASFPACENISDLTKEMHKRVQQAVLRTLPLRRWFLAVLLLPKIRWLWTSLRVIVRMRNDSNCLAYLGRDVKSVDDWFYAQMAGGDEKQRDGKAGVQDPFR